MAKKIDTKDFIIKIEKLAKSRMINQEVVSLDQFREFKNKVEPKLILVVEDDEMMRNSFRRLFDQEGILVKTVADGTELSTVLDDHAPDLIILDIGLPWINGFELGQMLKEHRELKKIPLVYISGIATDEDIKKAYAIGADQFIKKPFDVEEMKTIVFSLLGFDAEIEDP